MEFSQEKFNQVEQDAEAFYATIGQVHCPYLGDYIHFNALGFNHFKFRGWDRARNLVDQFARLRHITCAPEILRLSKTIQGIRRMNHFERTKVHSRWETKMKLVTYYEFIAIIESHGSKVRLKVIVKEIEGDAKIFWSIIPSWNVDPVTGERILSEGDINDEN